MQRILWLNHRDINHPRAGGAERTIYEVSTRLVKRGYEVVWLSTSYQGLPAFEEVKGVKIHRMGGNFSSHFRSILFERKQRGETVTIDDMAHVIPWLSERLTSAQGTVFFRHLHRRTLNGQLSSAKATIFKKIEACYPLMYKKWPFVTESRQSVQDLENMGIPNRRIVRIPPGVAIDKFRLQNKYDHPSLVYFGGLRDYKRAQEGLFLLTRLRLIYPDIKLRIVGDGPSLQGVKSLSSRMDLNENIEFSGRLDTSSLLDVISRSWLNLHFSVAEGWGLSILEAAASGTPTLAYKVPGVSEAIKDGVNGILVNSGDRTELELTAVSMLNDYKKWIYRSREYAKGFSWNKTTDMWESHLIKANEGYYT